MDLSLLVALALGVGAVLGWSLFRRTEPVPRCARCNLDMERDAAMLDPNDPATRMAHGGIILGEQFSGYPHLVFYHCPGCNRRARVRR
jgi:hypothetical protein